MILLTTYRQMAEDCVEKVIEETQSWKLPVGNAAGETLTNDRSIPRIYEPVAKDGFLGSSEAGKLNSDDVEELLRSQMVLTLEDFMVRRTSIYYKEEENGWKLVPKLKSSFQKVLAWDDAKWNTEVEDYKKYLEHHMGFALGRKYT